MVVGSLNTAAWTIILEQGLVVVIVIGRWLMPKGSHTAHLFFSNLVAYDVRDLLPPTERVYYWLAYF